MGKGLRLLHILPSIAPETGGPSFSIPMMCRALAHEGNEVCLLTTYWPRKVRFTELQEKRVEETFTIHLYPTKRNYLTGHLPHSPKLIEAAAQMAPGFDFTLVHSLWNPLATFAARAVRRLGLPYGIMCHGMLDPIVLKRKWWKKFPWLFIYEGENIEKARLMVFTSQRSREKAHESGLSFQRTFIFPHVLDLADWKNLPPREEFEGVYPQVKGREVILFVGRINWVKNLDKLISALALLKKKRPKAMVVCVGPDNDGYRKTLEKQARSLGVAEDLLFTGILDRKNLKTVYARADAFALLSKKENFGLFAAEALASGIPGVISEEVDIAPLFASDPPVRLVRPYPEETAAALDSILRRSLSFGLPDLEAQALAKREWGNNRVQALLQTYREILGRSS